MDNYEEGFDFNENNAGDFKVDMSLVNASGNAEEGIDYEEDDDFAGGGDLVTTMTDIVADDNGGDGGLKIREKGAGLLTANVTGVQANSNLLSGISIREDADGTLTANITKSRTLTNAAHGIDFDENSAGDLVATVTEAVSSGNTLYGVRADQALPGTGSLLLTPGRPLGQHGWNDDGQQRHGNGRSVKQHWRRRGGGGFIPYSMTFMDRLPVPAPPFRGDAWCLPAVPGAGTGGARHVEHPPGRRRGHANPGRGGAAQRHRGAGLAGAGLAASPQARHLPGNRRATAVVGAAPRGGAGGGVRHSPFRLLRRSPTASLLSNRVRPRSRFNH